MSNPSLGAWLMHVMKEADSALSLPDALRAIMHSLKEYFPCQSAAVLLIDDDTKALHIKIAHQISYSFVKKFALSNPSPLAEKAVLEQKPMMFNNVATDSDVYAQLKFEHDFTSAIISPIVKNQRSVGYLYCDRRDEIFSEPDLLHMQVLGYLIGSLMHKFELIKAMTPVSHLDTATKALNYNSFVTAFAAELARSRERKEPLVLALFGVPAFRTRLGVGGIDAAHALLTEVVTLASKQLAPVDILARFSADKFVLCISNTSEQAATAKIQTIRATVAAEASRTDNTPIALPVGAIILRTDAEMGKSLVDLLAAVGSSFLSSSSDPAETPIQIRSIT